MKTRKEVMHVYNQGKYIGSEETIKRVLFVVRGLLEDESEDDVSYAGISQASPSALHNAAIEEVVKEITSEFASTKMLPQHFLNCCYCNKTLIHPVFSYVCEYCGRDKLCIAHLAQEAHKCRMLK
jgi:hypothetical protein